MRSTAGLYARANATLLASWEAYARAATGAAVRRAPGVAAAVFPRGPERDVYNNALLDGNLTAVERMAALDTMEAAYAAAGVERFAAWIHERDRAMRVQLERRGYVLDTTTRAMGMTLADLGPPPSAEVRPAGWPEYLRVSGLPPGLLAGADPAALHVLVARLDGEDVASGIAYDHDGDCGIYNVATHPHARRRGLATALTARLAHDALARGCQTSSLQSTPAAERLYAAVGFRDLGRILEFVPAVVPDRGVRGS